MTTNKLWTTYHRKRTDEHRNNLVVHYLPLARLHAGHVHKKVFKYLSTDEILGAASFGLIQAVEAFDTSRKMKFESFAGFRIHGAIVDWLRELDTQTRTTRKFEKKRNQVIEHFGHNGMFDAVQIADKMNLSYKRYTSLNSRVAHGKQTYINIHSDDHDCSQIWDVKDRKCSDPSLATSRILLLDFISKYLNRVEHMIIISYYFEGLNMREIGEIVNLSESRISQMKITALDRIRLNLKDTIYENDHSLLT